MQYLDPDLARQHPALFPFETIGALFIVLALRDAVTLGAGSLVLRPGTGMVDQRHVQRDLPPARPR